MAWHIIIKYMQACLAPNDIVRIIIRGFKINQMNSDSRSTWGLPSEETRLELDGTSEIFLCASVKFFNWPRV